MDEKPTDNTEEQIKQQCIFCQIIEGKVSSRRVYEDDKCVAILDINPASPGHTLLLPKEHYAIMPMIPPHIIEHMFKVAKRISRAQIRSLEAQGTTIFSANGAAAGQKAPHFMIHIIPRTKDDGINAFNLPKNRIASEDQEKLRVAIAAKFSEQYGQGGVAGESKLPAAEKPRPQAIIPNQEKNSTKKEMKKMEEPRVEEQHLEEQRMEDAQWEELPKKDDAALQKQEIPATEDGLFRFGEEDAMPEEQAAEQQKAEPQKEEMFRIPPPEEMIAADENEEKELKPKKRFNLDMISNLFK